jgi:hypothetical protein
MHNKWIIYEMEKQRIQRRNLPASEYEQEIKKLCKRLGI